MAWLAVVLWFGGVGLVIGRDPVSFTVASFNLQNWGPSDRVTDGQYRSSAMKPEQEQAACAAILARVDADILFVQEILQDPQDRYIKQFAYTLQSVGLKYPFVESLRGEDPRIQIAVFSRLPFQQVRKLDQANFEISRRVSEGGKRHYVKEERKVSRGFLHVQVEPAPGYTCHLIGLHLKSRRNAPEFNTKEGIAGQELIRLGEAKLLRREVEAILTADPDANLALVGDFNDTPGSETLELLEGKKGLPNSLFNLWLKDWAGDQWTHFFRPEVNYSKIDQILVSPGLFREYDESGSWIYREEKSGESTAWWKASDHRAIRARFIATDKPSTFPR